MKRVWTEQELAEQWTVTATERAAVSRKSIRGRLHFVLLRIQPVATIWCGLGIS